ncbi:unnamed protein product [Rhizoctonia solani]|uniref:Uncharacterized protein n=1 Tax=Rhizoctonia solani TaxID=456999 RepID=A0A8H3H164_9AGAM|nr:unnamed protein product [Rhizoctonia solani]
MDHLIECLRRALEGVPYFCWLAPMLQYQVPRLVGALQVGADEKTYARGSTSRNRQLNNRWKSDINSSSFQFELSKVGSSGSTPLARSASKPIAGLRQFLAPPFRFVYGSTPIDPFPRTHPSGKSTFSVQGIYS